MTFKFVSNVGNIGPVQTRSYAHVFNRPFAGAMFAYLLWNTAIFSY